MTRFMKQVARRPRKFAKRDLTVRMRFPAAWYQGFTHRRLFDEVECFCMFIGYPRSGHSLVGSLLDAHPDVVLAHELDALLYLKAGLGRNGIYWLILKNDQRFTHRGRIWREFSYVVPNQWQGRFHRLRVIGDKKGGASTRRLARQPNLLDALSRTVGVKVRSVHVIRNPFDNIATMYRVGHGTLEDCVRMYFRLCHSVANIKTSSHGADMLDIRLETLISKPEPTMDNLCRWLNLEPTPGFLTDCASVIFNAPHNSRHEVKWTDDLIRSIEGHIDRVDFLQGYSFET
jgi:hypothetical protein